MSQLNKNPDPAWEVMVADAHQENQVSKIEVDDAQIFRILVKMLWKRVTALLIGVTLGVLFLIGDSYISPFKPSDWANRRSSSLGRRLVMWRFFRQYPIIGMRRPLLNRLLGQSDGKNTVTPIYHLKGSLIFPDEYLRFYFSKDAVSGYDFLDGDRSFLGFRP